MPKPTTTNTRALQFYLAPYSWMQLCWEVGHVMHSIDRVEALVTFLDKGIFVGTIIPRVCLCCLHGSVLGSMPATLLAQVQVNLRRCIEARKEDKVSVLPLPLISPSSQPCSTPFPFSLFPVPPSPFSILPTSTAVGLTYLCWVAVLFAAPLLK